MGAGREGGDLGQGGIVMVLVPQVNEAVTGIIVLVEPLLVVVFRCDPAGSADLLGDAHFVDGAVK